MEYYLAIKKNEVMPFAAALVDLEMVLLSEISQIEREKYPYDSTYMWNLKKKKIIQMNLFINRNRLTDFEKKPMVTKEETWLPRGRDEELGLDMHTRLYIK